MTQKRKAKPTRYTHSPWSGKKYDRPMTVDDLTRESMEILHRHPTISKCLRGLARPQGQTEQAP